MALRVPEMCFWPAKTRKNLNFLRWIHVFNLFLLYCWDISEENWLHLLFYFLVLMGIVSSVIAMSFLINVSSFRLKFSRIAESRKILQLASKTDLFTNGLNFVFFCWYMPRFVDFMSAWTKICKKCSSVILFWRHQTFSIVWGVFLSVL